MLVILTGRSGSTVFEEFIDLYLKGMNRTTDRLHLR